MPSGYGGQSQQRWGDNTVNQGEFSRDIQLSDLSGKVCATADARKKGMLLLVWFNTTSPLCKLALPYAQKIADAYKESGKLTVWGISGDDRARTEAFVQENGITFPVLLDHDRYHALVWGVVASPTFYLSDGGGVVLRKVAGWSREAMNDMSAKVAAGAGVEGEPAVIVGADENVPAVVRGY